MTLRTRSLGFRQALRQYSPTIREETGEMNKKLLLIFILSLTGACAASQAVQKAQRRPMQKSSVVLRSPQQYQQRTTDGETKAGEQAAYDPKPRIDTVDPKAGKYAFKWIGYDGKEKIVEYQRADAIDAVVSASVSRTSEGRYLYVYRVSNLPSSPTYLSSFTVQNFAGDAKPVKGEGVYVGTMSSQIQVFAEGNWIRFADSYLGDSITPGKEVELRVESSAPPGLVGCRVTAGNLTLKGVGEHMPTELEDAMPGYDEWPEGYTIGPVSNLSSLSRKDGIEYLLGRLPLFEKLGWLTPGAREWYVQHLKQDSPDAALRRAESDVKAEQITSEVYGMLQAVTRE